ADIGRNMTVSTGVLAFGCRLRDPPISEATSHSDRGGAVTPIRPRRRHHDPMPPHSCSRHRTAVHRPTGKATYPLRMGLSGSNGRGAIMPNAGKSMGGGANAQHGAKGAGRADPGTLDEFDLAS